MSCSALRLELRRSGGRSLEVVWKGGVLIVRDARTLVILKELCLVLGKVERESKVFLSAELRWSLHCLS